MSKIRRPAWLTASFVVFLLPALLIGLASVALAADTSNTSQSGGGGNSALPGDPTKGQSLYASSNCAGCHGGSLEGGVGPKLHPIVKLPDAQDPLDPNYLIDTITNGKQGVGPYGQMPAKGGKLSLSDQDIKDLAAYIIQVNRQKGPTPLSGEDLARSNVLWVSIGILAMLAFTYLLARYNMRWIARKAQRPRS